MVSWDSAITQVDNNSDQFVEIFSGHTFVVAIHDWLLLLSFSILIAGFADAITYCSIKKSLKRAGEVGSMFCSKYIPDCHRGVNGKVLGTLPSFLVSSSTSKTGAPATFLPRPNPFPTPMSPSSAPSSCRKCTSSATSGCAWFSLSPSSTSPPSTSLSMSSSTRCNRITRCARMW